MIKYLIRLIFAALFLAVPAMSAHSAEMVNVEYIHQYLNARWGIDLPYNPELKNPKVAANMEYLLTVVDIANEYLNGEKTTSYGTGEYATKLAADTIATNTAIDSLVHGPSFYITTTPDTTEFEIRISASGNFTIDWGDGKREPFLNTKVLSHTYASPGEYTIQLSGRATNYASSFGLPSSVINFSNKQNIASISGKLGRIFPTLENKNPTFYKLFQDATNLTSIPEDLFDGIETSPYVGIGTFMFASAFRNTGITSIPGKLFSGITSTANNMFDFTFSDTPITSIPENLFANLTEASSPSVFQGTFWGTNITSIPSGLFANLRGRIGGQAFYATFTDCKSLQSIPEDLFASISSAPATSMFVQTFAGTGITSIPENLFSTIRGAPASTMFASTFSGTNITSIPSGLFAGISGAPNYNMFQNTFSNCKSLKNIPADLFAGISGAPESAMFDGTFQNCTSLESIPENLFAGISGSAASHMFSNTFSGCTSLTGPSARIGGQYLYEIWPDIDYNTNTYSDATGLSDYEQIPANWK